MKNKNLIYLIILDCILMLSSLGVILLRYQAVSNVTLNQLSGVPDDPASINETKNLPDTELSIPSLDTKSEISLQNPPPDETKDPQPKQAEEKRNIAFNYRSSLAKKVEIIGDFNGWIPQALVKNSGHKWTINLQIPPGDYAYNLVVDGKPVRDPNNARKCNVGRGFTNSYLKVRPPSTKNEK